jgi:hypothetical protein
VYLDSYVKSYLNLTLVVKSQKLYRQKTYNSYQEELYNLCVKLKKKGLGYRRISYYLNDRGYKSVRGVKLLNTHIHSIIKKGLIRRERIKSLKSHNDYKLSIKDMKLEFKDIES